MNDALANIALAGFALAGLALVAFAALRAWNAWLDLKRLELAGGAQGGTQSGSMSELIEMADLRERIRKLESLAACIDL